MISLKKLTIYDDNIRIVPMTYEDVLRMRNWGKYEEDLLQEYNFTHSDENKAYDWFLWKTMHLKSRYFTAWEGQEMVAYLGLQMVNMLRGEGRLEIVLKPDRLNQGLGTKILETFLASYFGECDMKRMTLLVAPYNERAVHVFEKLGFKYRRRVWEDFVNEHFPEDLENSPWAKDFRKRLGKWQIRSILMRLNKADYTGKLRYQEE